MNKIFLVFTVFLVASNSALAAPVYHPSGPSLGYGNVTNGTSIISDVTNPAAGAATMDRESENLFRFGILSSIGGGWEFGDVNNMFDQIDYASTLIEQQLAQPDTNVNTAMNSLVTNLDTANNILLDIEKNAYTKVFASAHVPVFPLVISHKALGGSWVLDVNISIFAHASTLYDTVDFTPQNATDAANFIIANTSTVNAGTFGDLQVATLGNGTYNYNVDNDSTVLLKAAGITEAALGYSTDLLDSPFGKLFAGIRGKYYQVTLLQEIEKVNRNTDSQSTFDNISPDDGETTNAMGLDFGLLLVADNYRLGATLRNINEPEFNYNDLDLNANYAAGSTVAPRIKESSTYTMESQLSFEAALFNQGQDLMLNLAYDANPVMDPVGDEVQWISASIAYTGGFILPGLRAGLRKNMAGSELTYTTFGLTLFKIVNLDLALTNESVEHEGDKLPRGGMLNLGVEMTF